MNFGAAVWTVFKVLLVAEGIAVATYGMDDPNAPKEERR